MTATSAPVGTFLSSFCGSSNVGTPDGVQFWPLPSETLPSPVIRIRCPFFTTQPVLVQPLAVLSASTLTSHPIGFIFSPVLLVLAGGTPPRSVSSVVITLGVIGAFGSGFCSGLYDALRFVAVFNCGAPVGESNCIDSISAAVNVNCRRREPSPIVSTNLPA